MTIVALWENALKPWWSGLCGSHSGGDSVAPVAVVPSQERGGICRICNSVPEKPRGKRQVIYSSNRPTNTMKDNPSCWYLAKTKNFSRIPNGWRYDLYTENFFSEGDFRISWLIQPRKLGRLLVCAGLRFHSPPPPSCSTQAIIPWQRDPFSLIFWKY